MNATQQTLQWEQLSNTNRFEIGFKNTILDPFEGYNEAIVAIINGEEGEYKLNFYEDINDRYYRLYYENFTEYDIALTELEKMANEFSEDRKRFLDQCEENIWTVICGIENRSNARVEKINLSFNLDLEIIITGLLNSSQRIIVNSVFHENGRQIEADVLNKEPALRFTGKLSL